MCKAVSPLLSRWSSTAPAEMRVRQTVACVRTTRNCSQHDSLHYLIAQSSKHQWSSAVFICLVHSVPVDEVLQHSRFLSQSCSIVQRMRILIITVRGRQEKEVQLQNGGKNCKLRSTDLSLCACVWCGTFLFNSCSLPTTPRTPVSTEQEFQQHDMTTSQQPSSSAI